MLLLPPPGVLDYCYYCDYDWDYDWAWDGFPLPPLFFTETCLLAPLCSELAAASCLLVLPELL